MSNRTIRYSEAFKLKVVGEIEEGRFCSPFEASRVYGISGTTTVSRWIKKYGKDHLLKRFVRVETEDDIRELKGLKGRIKALETALADSVMDNALNESFFEILCERTNTDIAEFKKKHVGTASNGRRKKPKGRRA